MPAQHRFANHMQLFSLNSDDAGASLARSVRELFENALDATTPTDAGGSAQGGRIEVSLEEIDGGRFRVRVIDDGRGFGDDELHRVTELFSSSKGLLTAPHSSAAGAGLNDLGDASAGCFGVGLKTVLLWSHISAVPGAPANDAAVEIRTTAAGRGRAPHPRASGGGRPGSGRPLPGRGAARCT